MDRPKDCFGYRAERVSAMTRDADEHYRLGERWYNSENSKQWRSATARMLIMTVIVTVDRVATAAMMTMTGMISITTGTIQ